jgi:hypothetical protein
VVIYGKTTAMLCTVLDFEQEIYYQLITDNQIFCLHFRYCQNKLFHLFISVTLRQHVLTELKAIFVLFQVKSAFDIRLSVKVIIY